LHDAEWRYHILQNSGISQRNTATHGFGQLYAAGGTNNTAAGSNGNPTSGHGAVVVQ
jgi:hypothetical protein